MTSRSLTEAAFHESFLQRTAVDQVILVIQQTLKRVGKLCSVTRTLHGAYKVSFERGDVEVYISLQDGLILHLVIGRPIIRAISLAESCRVLESHPGVVSYLLLRNGEEVVQQNADMVLPVASSSKLAILNALSDSYVLKLFERSTTIRLTEKHKSHATGILQTWPAGTELTVDSLAMLMISLSDNTAADVLLETVGTAMMSPYLHANRPYLSTRQVAQLRADTNSTSADAWLNATTEEDRMMVLHDVDALALERCNMLQKNTSPSTSLIKSTEWLYSVRQLCELISRAAVHPATRINVGHAIDQRWGRIAYKGGLDFGIANATYDLETADGTHFVLSATWNCEVASFSPDQFFDGVSGLVNSLL